MKVVVVSKQRSLPEFVSKKKIIKALQTEFLSAGQFVKNGYLPEVGTCGVCAVGAVLRSVGQTDIQIAYIAREIAPAPRVGRNKIGELLEKRGYMSALSSYFEEMLRNNKAKYFVERCCDRDDNNRTLISYVKAAESATNTISMQVPTKLQRKRLIAFVEKNFPNRVRLIPRGAQ